MTRKDYKVGDAVVLTEDCYGYEKGDAGIIMELHTGVAYIEMKGYAKTARLYYSRFELISSNTRLYETKK